MANVQKVNTKALGPVVSRVQTDAVLGICAQLKDIAAPLIPILHAVQEKIGFVPPDAVPLIARELNLSIAEVHGVVSFYHYFRQDAGGRHVVHLCRAEACQAVGAAQLEAHAKRSLGRRFSWYDPRRRHSPGARVLPRQLLAGPVDHDRP